MNNLKLFQHQQQALTETEGQNKVGLVYSTLETLSFGYYQDLKQIEVIGNIYDNPELLGDENNDKL